MWRECFSIIGKADVARSVVLLHESAKLLGIVLNAALTTDRHVNQAKVICTCNYYSRAFQHVQALLTLDVDSLPWLQQSTWHDSQQPRQIAPSAECVSQGCVQPGLCVEHRSPPVQPSCAAGFAGCRCINSFKPSGVKCLHFRAILANYCLTFGHSGAQY